ncbi:hypothetical protein ACFL6I_16500 [candidate division KSB1 bacterium]
MKKTLIFFVALFMLTALSVSAATFKAGDVYEYKGGGTADDIYIAGGSIDVSGDINGDGILAGGEVSVLGDVTEDVTAAGGSVRLLGSIGDDVRVAGGNITVSGRVGDDLVAAGGFVKILSGSTIAGDTVIAGGTTVMNGAIDGDLTIYGEDVTINGSVNGNVTLKFTKRVTFGDDAVILGNLTYSALEEVYIPTGVLIGGYVTRVETPMKKFNFDKNDLGAFIGFFVLIKFLLMLVVGVLAVIVFRKFSNTMSVQTHDNFWKNLLIGFIVFIVIPITAVLLLATVIGIYIGFILLSMYALALLIAKVYAGIVAGALLSKWIKKEIIVDWKWAVLGIAALQIVSLVPLFGGFAVCILVLATFGTLGTLVYKTFWLAR